MKVVFSKFVEWCSNFRVTGAFIEYGLVAILVAIVIAGGVVAVAGSSEYETETVLQEG